MNKGLVGSDFVESIEHKADRIADRVRSRIGCENVFVSIQIDQRLFSLGLASDPDDVPPPRKHNAADTVCANTIKQGGILLAEDAREDGELSRLTYVKDGVVCGYLGYPIRDSEGKCYGALCAITAEPREWTEDEINIVEAAACEAGSLFAVQQLRNELSGLHRYLDEADRALMTLANSLSAMVSVHGESGSLLFASSNLRVAFDEDSLVDAVRRSLASEAVAKQLATGEPDGDAVARVREMSVRTTSGDSATVSAQIRSYTSGTFYVYWKTGISQLLN